MQLKSLTCLLIAATLAVATAAHAQEADKHPTIQQLDTQWKAGELETRQYINAVNDWVNLQVADGVHFHRDTLIRLLSTFRQLAWSADSLSVSRINYFINLADNANFGNREGEAIYFLEKAEQEIIAAHDERPLLVAGQKCNTYLDMHNYGNVIATYEGVRDYLKQFPELIRTKSINFYIGASFINVLNPTADAYAHLGDTTGVNETIALAEAIYSELEKQMGPENYTGFIINFYMKNLYFHKYFTAEKNEQQSWEALNAMREALYVDNKDKQAGMVQQLTPELETKLVEYFLTYQQNDSATYYLEKMKASPGVYIDNDYTLNRFEARLLANQGRYRQAFERSSAAADDIDSLRSVLVNDIDELLYAHTEAEFNRQALQVAEQQKQRRTLWLIAVSVAAALAIVITSLVIRRRNRKTREQLEKLNQAANIQIAALEEIKAQAVRDEQRRLARDLHDGLSATLASAKLQLEMLAMDSGPDTAEKATRIQRQIEQAYAIARGKSHQWYDDADSSEDTDFEHRIQQVLDSALADSRYTKEVHVDNGTLAGIALDVRIDLLRIVQEAITNTIKHAKARHVSVLLYREEAELLLSVADNGNGMKTKNTAYAGVGIRSMRERSEQHGGRLSIESGQQGTQITASFPLAPPMAG